MKYLLVIVCSILLVAAPQMMSAQANGPKMTFEVKDDTYNFGKVVDGEVVTYNYVFKNTGNQPLIIYKTEVACNCTSADWPKRPVMPGQTSQIKVTYKSEGNVGKVNKQIYIKSNAKLPAKYSGAYELNLLGEVTAK